MPPFILALDKPVPEPIDGHTENPQLVKSTHMSCGSVA